MYTFEIDKKRFGIIWHTDYSWLPLLLEKERHYIHWPKIEGYYYDEIRIGKLEIRKFGPKLLFPS